MILRKPPKFKRVKASIGKGDYDLEFSAMLFFMWKAGMLKAYPLNPLLYPDNADTLEKLSVAFLRMKLREDLSQDNSGFRNKLCFKTAKKDLIGI